MLVYKHYKHCNIHSQIHRVGILKTLITCIKHCTNDVVSLFPCASFLRIILPAEKAKQVRL